MYLVCLQTDCKCKFSCSCISTETRVQLFRTFYDAGNYSTQQAYLRGYIRPTLIARRRNGTYGENIDASRRQRSFKYMLPLRGGSEVQVCKKTFCATFGVTPRRVQLLADKIIEGNVSVNDKRGGFRPKKNHAWKEKISNHIRSFPTMVSHYSRHDSPNKRFLSPDLNVSKMYRAFIDAYEEDHTPPPVSRQWYHKIFKTDFKLGFGQPRTDTCSSCDLLKTQIDGAENEEERRNFTMQLELHHRKAESGQQAMSKDSQSAKSNNETLVISFDMQQQMFLPQLTHSQMYYSRQLAVCNLGIHVENTNQGIMNMWSENQGGRGSVEVASCLYNILTTDVIKVEQKQLILWSDNCGAQNKNQQLLAMYLTLIAKGYFNEITHKFPTSGHTFLSCDRDFAVIEKAKKRSSPQVPRDLLEIVGGARINTPYLVCLPSGFFDWKKLAQEKLTTSKLKISQACEIKVSKEQFGHVGVRLGHSPVCPWIYTDVTKSGVTLQDFQNCDVVFSPTPRRISDAKRADIRAMLPFMTKPTQEFYCNLIDG